MPTQIPLPPTPPRNEQGFDWDIWQRWLEIVRRRLAEAYSPDNPPPSELGVSANAGALGEALQKIDDLATLLLSLPDQSANVGQLRKDAALQFSDVEFNSVKIDTTLTVVGGFGVNGASPQTAVTLPADATDLPTAITLVNAIKALLIANGQAQ